MAKGPFPAYSQWGGCAQGSERDHEPSYWECAPGLTMSLRAPLRWHEGLKYIMGPVSRSLID